ncbi:hypothetical protein HYC85_009049 [Camellia sinensis]|uniref:Uncharacterized protein n=1 Tax=Camellia sinensis TaxID=4442 RepID=A0A7J7HTP0_CAMSI|nr:hypothetical protein HYC85_009049 [Camellia sinensis]
MPHPIPSSLRLWMEGCHYSLIPNSFQAGLAASGALTSALRLMTKEAFERTDNGLSKGAMLFLAISTFFDTTASKAALEGSKTVMADLAAAGIRTEAPTHGVEDDDEQERFSNKQLFTHNIDYALDLYLTYVLTFIVFPGFVSENTGSHHHLGSW